MGWTGVHREPGVTDRAFFQDMFGDCIEIIDCASLDRNVFYAACRSKKEPGAVWGLVCLMHWTRDWWNFTYKDMDETMGPYEAECPSRILDLLTPTESEYANDWRARCREHAARLARNRLVKAGMRVRFSEPLRFTDGNTLQDFTFVKGSTFTSGADGYLRYHIAHWRDRLDAEIIA